jgi:hypothetical protein
LGRQDLGRTGAAQEVGQLMAGGSREGAGLCSRLAIALVLALCGIGTISSSALAYRFNEPFVKATGPEEVVFDWETNGFDPITGEPIGDACDREDIPNSGARAYRNKSGQVVLFTSHFTARRFVGTGPAPAAFDKPNLTHPCDVVMQSTESPDPTLFDDKEWISSPYRPDPATDDVYSLGHEEYQGWLYDPTNCQIDEECWFNSITLATSTDGGASFTSVGAANLVATSPYQFASGNGPYGYFKPTNIVLDPDGYYYAMMRALTTPATPAQKQGVCLMRTQSLADPGSWRGWDGTGFNVSFINPYTQSGNPADHVCEPVDPDLYTMSSALVYSKYLGRYVLVDLLNGGGSYNPLPADKVPGIYYSTSADLIHWDPPKLLMEAEITETFECGDDNPVRVPSLIDHTSGSRNFETIGQRAYLYFVRANMQYDQTPCYLDFDRDLVRIPVEFFQQSQPPPPATSGGGSGGGGGGGGGADEQPPDTKAAKVTISSGKRQDVDKLAITILLDEDAIVQASGGVNVPFAGKVYSFKKVRKKVAANKRVKLKLKLASKNLKKVKRALRRGEKRTAKVKVAATDTDGNNSVKRISIKLKP